MTQITQKYEAQIAKSTLPKGTKLLDLTIDKWYPVIKREPIYNKKFLFYILDDVGDKRTLLSKNSASLNRGNWKIRKVKSNV